MTVQARLARAIAVVIDDPDMRPVTGVLTAALYEVERARASLRLMGDEAFETWVIRGVPLIREVLVLADALVDAGT